MTVREIHEAVKIHKAVSRPQLYNYFEALKIKPVGARQRPQQFPSDTVVLILNHLGLGTSTSAKNGVATGGSARNGANHRQSAHVPTMTELRASRKKARAGK